MFENTGVVVGKNVSDERYAKPSLINSINSQLHMQGRGTFKGPNIQVQSKNGGNQGASLAGNLGNAQRYNYENRVVQAHRELQQFFQKFETDNDGGDSRCSQLKNSVTEDASEKDEKSDK